MQLRALLSVVCFLFSLSLIQAQLTRTYDGSENNPNHFLIAGTPQINAPPGFGRPNPSLDVQMLDLDVKKTLARFALERFGDSFGSHGSGSSVSLGHPVRRFVQFWD